MRGIDLKKYRAGIDVGSTTVKLVILGEDDKVIFSEYKRHLSHTQAALAALIENARKAIGDCGLLICITGSGSINMGKALGIDFVQEVVAVADVITEKYPETDVAVELGGEDAKIIYFEDGLDERMNGICAGGTGSFIDQMASLLKTDATGLNEAAKEHREIYPIAARCGVFAKTDIQPLINEGASRADLAASIFQAVVNQTISGLACGKPIRGCVAFLGGPLHFLDELKNAFIRTLRLEPYMVVDPPDSHLFAAMGAAFEAGRKKDIEPRMMSGLMKSLSDGVKMEFEIKRLPALFENEEEFEEFKARHEKASVKKGRTAGHSGKCFLGIDAGSTTTKLALIGGDGELLWSYYSNNDGDPIRTAVRALDILNKERGGTVIARSCSTGYGEALLKAAFRLDYGEVETIAHTTAASFFDPDVDCVLDIGGQDMKCIRLKNRTVDTVLLNEACSSGCGSFIENFAASLGYDAAGFAKEALYAKAPIDLGTRCTVFMNSNVKQAQKEGASVSDISAGLAYSVIRNALFKVIKLPDARELGRHIVVQGGTFYNRAVLRAFEKIAGVDVICPDICGIMGAFGAALIARDRYLAMAPEERESGSSMLSFEEIHDFTYRTAAAHCSGCANRCLLTVNIFPDSKRFITGNRCEKVIKNSGASHPGYNMVEYRKERIFGYDPLCEEDAVRGVIGIPRVLNIFENYPYWATFFKELRFRTVLSPFSTRKLYETGMESIPSESECYPAKLAHGHVQWLCDQGINTIFHPSVFYEYKETKNAQNNFNCPIVIAYPENLKNNVEDVASGKVRYIRPFISFASEKAAEDRLAALCKKEWGIGAKEVRRAARKAWKEQRRAKDDIRSEGERVLTEMERRGGRGIVIAGRPYHTDPEINHGIPELIASYGLDVFTEDSIPYGGEPERPLRVVDQWVYHSRMYRAAEFVRSRDDLEILQLNSFGCGLDAVTTDQMAEILEKSGKLYTVLKIDEVSNLGAARIRIRSLIAAMDMRQREGICARPVPVKYEHSVFTKDMKRDGYTILGPQMSPIHFDILEPAFRRHGYNVEILKNATKSAVDIGLKYVNNDACYPSIVMVGQFMEAVLSGKYDTDRLALITTQTGGCCRASNYVAFIRRALDKAGLSKIPVISINLTGIEKQKGFSFTLPLIKDAVKALIYGDTLMRCLYRVRPYEFRKGSADTLYKKWRDICIASVTGKRRVPGYREILEGIVSDFDRLPVDDALRKPRVGIVGEILVKYMPLANNELVRLLESEGAEAVVPDLTDFFSMCFFEQEYRHEYLGKPAGYKIAARAGVKLIDSLRAPAVEALKKSSRFDAPVPMKQIAALAKPIISLGNQYGEGWFLTGEMIELIKSGTPNIVCIQPFGCLPNHVVGKGVIKAIKRSYSEANIAAVDYDPGASEVNQLNRIKLMLSAAARKMEEQE